MEKTELTKFSLYMPVEYHRLLKIHCIKNKIKMKDFFTHEIEKIVKQEKEKEEKK